MVKQKWLQVRIDEERKEKLRRVAERKGISMSDLIINFIDSLE